MTVTLIAGSNKGLGYQTARQLAGAGHTVYVGVQDPERGRRAAERLGARFVQLDVTDDASVAAAVKTIEADGGLGVPVTNASIEGRIPDNGVIPRTRPPCTCGRCSTRTCSAWSECFTGSCRCCSAPPPPGDRLPGLENCGQHADGPVRQKRSPASRSTPSTRLHRNRPRRPHRHPDHEGGHRDHRPDGLDRPGRPHQRVLRRQRPHGLVARQTRVTSVRMIPNRMSRHA
jgi:short subunit dehydrogenase